MLFISRFKCIIVCVHMHACIHVCVHACMGVWTFSSLYKRSYMCVCMHACMYILQYTPSPPPPPKVLMLASLGMPPPHNIEKLPTPMIYIGHVQNGAIFCCNAWITQRIWRGGGGEAEEGGGGIRVGYSTCHICFV